MLFDILKRRLQLARGRGGDKATRPLALSPTRPRGGRRELCLITNISQMGKLAVRGVRAVVVVQNPASGTRMGVGALLRGYRETFALGTTDNELRGLHESGVPRYKLLLSFQVHFATKRG